VFHRERDDLLCEVPISFPQAALGAHVDVPTLEEARPSSTCRKGRNLEPYSASAIRVSPTSAPKDVATCTSWCVSSCPHASRRSSAVSSNSSGQDWHS